MNHRLDFHVLLTRCVVAMVVGLYIGQATAQSEGYPNKAIRFMVSFPAGSGTDTAARFVMGKLAERLGQPVVLDNLSGAGGAVGANAIAKSAPDGYTIGFGGAGSLAISATLRDLPYDPLTDFAPITMFANNPMILAAHPSFPANNLSELIALAKTKPGTIGVGTSGLGTTMHLAGPVLNQMAGIELFPVHFRGNAPSVTALLGGQIPLAIIDISTAYGYVKQGQLKALGATGPTRSLAAPEIPTFAESGLPGYSVMSWYGVVAPAGTPPKIIKLLNAELVAILQNADVRERLLAAGPEPAPTTPEEFADIIRSENARWARVLKENNISAK